MTHDLSPHCYSSVVSEQSAETPARRPLPGAPSGADGEFTPAELLSRRQPGDPHPYMLQRNPPNLWMLAAMTAGALVTAVIVLALTILL